MGLSRTVSEIDGDFRRKLQKLSTLLVFCVPNEGILLGIWYRRWESRYWNVGATGPRKKFDDIFSLLDTMLQHDRQTPGDSKDRAYA